MPLRPNEPRKLNRKSNIISTTADLLRLQGLSGVTTRAIAQAVPCSEGAIYVHFKSRSELLLAVFEASLPAMLIPLHALKDQVGTKTPQKNLTKALKGLQSFHERTAPMLGSLFAEPELLHNFRRSLAMQGKGPAGGIARIARYIREEQQIARLPEDLDAEVIASILMSVSFFQAFTQSLLGMRVPPASAKRLVESLL